MDEQPAKSTLSSLIFQRNIDRFPEDFMFELSENEKKQLLRQESRLANLKHSYAPIMVFSEQGVAMLSSVLNSKRAIYTNIKIMRAFVSYRAMIFKTKS